MAEGKKTEGENLLKDGEKLIEEMTAAEVKERIKNRKETAPEEPKPKTETAEQQQKEDNMKSVVLTKVPPNGKGKAGDTLEVLNNAELDALEKDGYGYITAAEHAANEQTKAMVARLERVAPGTTRDVTATVDPMRGDNDFSREVVEGLASSPAVERRRRAAQDRLRTLPEDDSQVRDEDKAGF